jgi:hypothetical protein
VVFSVGVEDSFHEVGLIEHTVNKVFTIWAFIQKVNKDVGHLLVQDVVEGVLAEVV